MKVYGDLWETKMVFLEIDIHRCTGWLDGTGDSSPPSSRNFRHLGANHKSIQEKIFLKVASQAQVYR